MTVTVEITPVTEQVSAVRPRLVPVAIQLSAIAPKLVRLVMLLVQPELTMIVPHFAAIGAHLANVITNFAMIVAGCRVLAGSWIGTAPGLACGDSLQNRLRGGRTSEHQRGAEGGDRDQRSFLHKSSSGFASRSVRSLLTLGDVGVAKMLMPGGKS